MTDTAASSPRRWILVCLCSTALVMLLAFMEIERVAKGQLFAYSFPWEQAPSSVELFDAKLSAKTYRVPALLALAMLGAVVCYAAVQTPASSLDRKRAWRPQVLMFLLATLGDLVTTVWFFHVHGVDYELHPGIRLLGYAYGRTVGAVAGKTIQAVGVLFISSLLGRWGAALLVVATIVTSLAATYNVSLLL